MPERHLVVTVDTEVDKSADWSVSESADFPIGHSCSPELMAPLCERFGIKATYLLSPEVIEDPASQQALLGLAAQHQLGAHLHGDFITPEPRPLAPQRWRHAHRRGTARLPGGARTGEALRLDRPLHQPVRPSSTCLPRWTLWDQPVDAEVFGRAWVPG